MSKKIQQLRITYQLKITLHRSKPPIWRRILVAGDTTLSELHDIIQDAMGWYNSHLHQFTINNVDYGPSSYDDMFGGWDELEDESRIKLRDFVTGEKFKFRYDYDFGDDWAHRIVVEKILPYDPKQKLPVCIKGKRACPPEDVGGVWGYESFLEIMKNPQHPEYGMYKEWVGGDVDPEAFNLDMVNSRLQR